MNVCINFFSLDYQTILIIFRKNNCFYFHSYISNNVQIRYTAYRNIFWILYHMKYSWYMQSWMSLFTLLFTNSVHIFNITDIFTALHTWQLKYIVTNKQTYIFTHIHCSRSTAQCSHVIYTCAFTLGVVSQIRSAYNNSNHPH